MPCGRLLASPPWRNFSNTSCCCSTERRGRCPAPRCVPPPPGGERHRDAAWSAGRHELGGVRQQVDQHLQQPVAVGLQRGHALGSCAHARAALAEGLGGGLHRVRDQLAQVDRLVRPLRVAGFDLRHVQHLVDEPGQAFRRRCHHQGRCWRCSGPSAGRRASARRRRGSRSAACAARASPGHESSFSRSRLVGAGGSARAPATSPGRGVEHAQDVVGPERLLLHHRGHHRARRGAADRAGELRLDVLHQRRIGHRAFGIGVPRRRASSANRRSAGSAPRKRAASAFNSASWARPRQNTGAPALRSARRRTAPPGWPLAPFGRLGQRHRHVGPRLASRLHSSACVRLSSPVRPRSCSGLKARGRRAVVEEAAASSPTWRSRAAAASSSTARSRRQAGQRPGRVPPFQYMPPSSAGANCATAAKLISPMLTSA